VKTGKPSLDIYYLCLAMSHPSHRVRVRPPVSPGKLCEDWQAVDIYYLCLIQATGSVYAP
jgi:hypothetical protein